VPCYQQETSPRPGRSVWCCDCTVEVRAEEPNFHMEGWNMKGKKLAPAKKLEKKQTLTRSIK
jgi:hypothetical protein